MTTDALPPRRNGARKSPETSLETPPAPESPASSAGTPLPPGLVYADPDRQKMPAPYRFPAALMPPAPPPPAPGEQTRVCAFCGARMPASALAYWADSSAICADTAACQQRAAVSGLYPVPAEA
jgi:hypothetical protein